MRPTMRDPQGVGPALAPGQAGRVCGKASRSGRTRRTVEVRGGLIGNGTVTGVSRPMRAKLPPSTVPISVGSMSVLGVEESSASAEQRVQPQRAGIGLQLGQHVRPVRQILQPSAHRRSQPCHHLLGEGLLETAACGIDPVPPGHWSAVRCSCCGIALAPPPPAAPGSSRSGRPHRPATGPALLIVLGRRVSSELLTDLRSMVRLRQEYFENNPATYSTAAGGTSSG